MQRLVRRAANIILRPESEWSAIAGERSAWLEVGWRYLAPLALISPLAYGCSVLIGGASGLRPFADVEAAWHFALLSAGSGFVVSPLSVTVIALVIWLVAPLYAGRRSFSDAFRVVTYAGTPVWLSGIVLIAPLDRFPLLSAIIVIAIMHCMFLFYLGLHHVMKVPRRDAAECTAIVVVGGIMLSSIAGYYGSAAGLFPHL
jgi:hypothetical protein